MGMGYSANFADVIDDEHVKELCPAEHNAFMDALEKEGLDFEDFAREESYEDFDNEAVTAAYDALREAFNVASRGAYLTIGYHDSDNKGDRYDEVSGAYWDVDGLTAPTKAAKFLGKKVKRQGFVILG